MYHYYYIATPYTHPDHAVMEQRYEDACETVAVMLNTGIHVYSPIVHCHAIAVKYNLPRDITFWQNYNETMLAHAKELRILKLDGWDTSKGIQHEIDFAMSRRILVSYISPELYITK